jgi:hypothetical protein
MGEWGCNSTNLDLRTRWSFTSWPLYSQGNRPLPPEPLWTLWSKTKSCPWQVSNSRHPESSPSLYGLSYSDSSQNNHCWNTGGYENYLSLIYSFRCLHSYNLVHCTVNSRVMHVASHGLGEAPHSSSFLRGGPGGRSGLVKWDLWWTKWCWGSFSPSTSVSPANLHSTNCFTITLTYHLGLVQ